MHLLRDIKEHLGWKIAILTSVVLFVVAGLLIFTLSVIEVQFFSKFNLIQILAVSVILLALVSVMAIYISTMIFVQRPLGKLLSVIRKAEKGDLNVRVQNESEDEIGDLAHQFNQMLHRIGELDTKKIRTERQLIQAQEELKYKKALEEKSKIIEETNQKLARSFQDLSLLYQVSQSISSTLEKDELYNVLLDVVVKTLGFQEFALLEFDEKTQKLVVKLAYGFEDNERVKDLSFDLGEGISGKVAQQRQVVYIEDTSQDSLYLHYKGEKNDHGSFLSVPILSHQKLHGVMNFTRPHARAFSEMEIKLLVSLAVQIGSALENAKLFTQTKELSVTDELTQIFNRRHFQQMLNQEWKRALRFQRNVSLLMIDADHFKRFNDSYGHLQGDQALIQIAKTLSSHVREVDTVARYGGEEFAIILTHTSLEDAQHVAEKLRAHVEKHPILDTQGAIISSISISIGVSNYPQTASNMDDLLNQADMALYDAKGQGRNRVVAFQDAKTVGHLRILS
ncbi:MAG: diguanylate cyclase [Deltaproteobacteria bacterium]|nr:diguanylate cyclase [Deltaproteobacteria bacterium]